MKPYEVEATMRRNMRRLRIEKKWTQGKLAKKACVGADTINVMEKGRRSGLLVTWLLIAEALGVTLVDLATPHDGGGGSIEEEADD